MRVVTLATSKYVLIPIALMILIRPPGALNRLNRIDLILILVATWFAARTVVAITSWKEYGAAEKAGYFRRAMCFLSVIVFLGLTWSLNGVFRQIFSTEKLSLLAVNQKGYELHTLELYPYTVFHPRENVRVTGSMPLERNDLYDDFEVESGDHGFFVDFDLDAPPPKAADEFRIILIGGSTAQGYGGRTNEEMLYRILERKLRAEFSPLGIRIRVINLALANSVTYQNYIALNKWGHDLQPDLILSFSGVNDITVPLLMGLSDLPFRFQGVMGLYRSTWTSENPKLFDDVCKYVPSLNDSLVGIAVRTLSAPERGHFAANEYGASHHHARSPRAAEAVVRQYTHALKSIKRDFQGIPMVVAFQPHYGLFADFDEYYQVLVEQTPLRLRNYVNDRWHFFNVTEHFRQKGFLNRSYMQEVHLLNPGHEAAADYLAREIGPILREIRRPAAPASEKKTGALEKE